MRHALIAAALVLVPGLATAQQPGWQLQAIERTALARLAEVGIKDCTTKQVAAAGEKKRPGAVVECTDGRIFLVMTDEAGKDPGPVFRWNPVAQQYSPVTP
jgi:hypothetical protein